MGQAITVGRGFLLFMVKLREGGVQGLGFEGVEGCEVSARGFGASNFEVLGGFLEVLG